MYLVYLLSSQSCECFIHSSHWPASRSASSNLLPFLSYLSSPLVYSFCLSLCHILVSASLVNFSGRASLASLSNATAKHATTIARIPPPSLYSLLYASLIRISLNYCSDIGTHGTFSIRLISYAFSFAFPEQRLISFYISLLSFHFSQGLYSLHCLPCLILFLLSWFISLLHFRHFCLRLRFSIFCCLLSYFCVWDICHARSWQFLISPPYKMLLSISFSWRWLSCCSPQVFSFHSQFLPFQDSAKLLLPLMPSQRYSFIRLQLHYFSSFYEGRHGISPFSHFQILGRDAKIFLHIILICFERSLASLAQAMLLPRLLILYFPFI